MKFDLFCSLSQTPRSGQLPSHAEVLTEFLDQAVLADDLGFGCVWAAESHFSSEAQKSHSRPAIPHWTGEVGVNVDVCQLATQVFRRTSRVEVGSAIMNIVANGGPVPAAERVAAALAWHGLDDRESRRLHIGFAGGRFDFISSTTGIRPRAEWEQEAWRQVKAAILREAAEIFVRLLNGEVLSSEDVPEQTLTRDQFPSPEQFRRAADMAGADEDGIAVPRRWSFEATGIVPEFRRDLLQLVIGTHDPELQTYLNRFAPVRVFNLSFTPSDVIEETHERMTKAYHPSGGPWLREYMPRTVLVFLNADAQLSPSARHAAAAEEASRVLAAYWRALDGTIDEAKVASSANNAVLGDPQEVADEIRRRFDPGDRLMLWCDFFAESGQHVADTMRAFGEHVLPLVAAGSPRSQGVTRTGTQC